MTDLTGTTLHESDIDELRKAVGGGVIGVGDEEYDEVRALWNGLIDKSPAVIARCTATGDVVEAIHFARKHDLDVAVRGRGHNVAGNAMCDAGIVIDLSHMREVDVDPKAKTARVQPGADWGDVDRATQRHGLVTPGGQVSTTGVAGFTLAGGMGFLRRKWGLACDNVVSVEIVTADGQVLTADETENPDLFWAVRGGGGNFGVVTSFAFRLHELGPEIFGAVTVYPFAEAGSVLRGWRDFVLGASDEVTCDALVWGMPPFPDVPAEMHWSPVVILAAMYAGSAEDGESALQPVRTMGTPLGDLSARQPYVKVQSDLDALFPNGQLYYWKSLFADAMTDEVIDTMVERYADRPSPQALFGLRGLGGKMGRIAEDQTAYANRDAMFNISIDNIWQDPERTDDMIAWARDVWKELRDLTGGGVYLNFAGFGEENDMLARAAYGTNYGRLAEVKRRYDPENLFRGNVNVAP